MNNNIPNYHVGQTLVGPEGTLYPITKVTDSCVSVMNLDGGTLEIDKNDLYNYSIKEFFTHLHGTINHPNHYNREGAMECIDEMELIFGREAVRTFCILNAWKYRYRANAKNGEEDMKKADWYIKKVKELDLPF